MKSVAVLLIYLAVSVVVSTLAGDSNDAVGEVHMLISIVTIVILMIATITLKIVGYY